MLDLVPYFPILIGGMTLIGVILTVVSSYANNSKLSELHILINSRLTQLLDSKEMEAKARVVAASSEGEARGKAKEVAGQAREDIGRAKATEISTPIN